MTITVKFFLMPLSVVVLFAITTSITVADDHYDSKFVQYSPFISELLPLRKISLWVNIDSIVAKYIQPGVDVSDAKAFLFRNGFVIRSHSTNKLSANYKTGSQSSIIDTDIVINMGFDQNRVNSISGAIYNGLFFMGNLGFIRNVDRSLFNDICAIKGQWRKLNITNLVERYINLEMNNSEIEEIMFNNGFRLFKYDNRYFSAILEDNNFMNTKPLSAVGGDARRRDICEPLSFYHPDILLTLENFFRAKKGD